MIEENLFYTKEHEWIAKEGDTVVIGITDYAQEELGDIVFAELPEPGTSVQAGDSPVTLESVKAVSSVYAPFSGKVTEINDNLNDAPELINSSPFDKGWILKIETSEFSDDDLMNFQEYRDYTASLD